MQKAALKGGLCKQPAGPVNQLERAKRFELSTLTLEGYALPLSYARIRWLGVDYKYLAWSARPKLQSLVFFVVFGAMAGAAG